MRACFQAAMKFLPAGVASNCNPRSSSASTFVNNSATFVSTSRMSAVRLAICPRGALSNALKAVMALVSAVMRVVLLRGC